MSGTITCQHCKGYIEIPDGQASPFIKCPSCQKMNNVPVSYRSSKSSSPRPQSSSALRPPSSVASPSGGFPNLPSSSSPPPDYSASPSSRVAVQQPSLGTNEPGDELPELMKANKRLAGKACTICQAPIQMGDPVHNCMQCRQPSHQQCWNRSNGCGAPACNSVERTPDHVASRTSKGMTLTPDIPDDGQGAEQANLVPCRWCKEPIMRGARKCKHCNEFQKDEDREMALKQSHPGGQEGSGISTVDWVLIVICPGITCLGGIIRMLLGYPDAGKVVAYSLISIGIQAAIRAAGGGH